MSTKVLIFKKITCITEWLYFSLKQRKHLEVLEIAENLSAALTNCQRHKPQILLICLDRQIETKNIIRQFLAIQPQLKIIALTTHPNSHQTKEALASGAYGHIAVEHSISEELITAIEYALSERAYLCRDIATELANDSRKNGLNQFETIAALASREEQILKLIAKGYGSKEISSLLHISPSTVDVHRRNIMRKTGLHKVADLTRYAIRHRLVETVMN